MQRLEVSGAVRPIYGSFGVKRLISIRQTDTVMLWKVQIWWEKTMWESLMLIG